MTRRARAPPVRTCLQQPLADAQALRGVGVVDVRRSRGSQHAGHDASQVTGYHVFFSAALASLLVCGETRLG
jgi:hypothetical protein